MRPDSRSRINPWAPAMAVVVFLAVVLAWPPLSTAREAHWSKGQAIYIPAYAYVRIHGKKQTLPLTTTLFVHNTSLDAEMTVTSVKHYGGDGKLIREYAPEPVRLGSLAALELLVKEPQESRGGGACFVITWKADQPISPPLAESVMIGTAGQQGISYRSTGQVIKELN